MSRGAGDAADVAGVAEGHATVDQSADDMVTFVTPMLGDPLRAVRNLSRPPITMALLCQSDWIRWVASAGFVPVRAAGLSAARGHLVDRLALR